MTTTLPPIILLLQAKGRPESAAELARELHDGLGRLGRVPGGYAPVSRVDAARAALDRLRTERDKWDDLTGACGLLFGDGIEDALDNALDPASAAVTEVDGTVRRLCDEVEAIHRVTGDLAESYAEYVAEAEADREQLLKLRQVVASTLSSWEGGAEQTTLENLFAIISSMLPEEYRDVVVDAEVEDDLPRVERLHRELGDEWLREYAAALKRGLDNPAVTAATAAAGMPVGGDDRWIIRYTEQLEARTHPLDVERAVTAANAALEARREGAGTDAGPR